MLGFAHPDYLLPWLTARQLEDWLEWMRKTQPFPGRYDPAFALLTAVVHNGNCADESDAVRPVDMLIYHDQFDEELTADELRARLGLKG